MAHNLQQINKHIMRLFGEVLQKEALLTTDALVTISRIDTAPNLKNTTIWLYVQPIAQADAILAELTEQLYDLQGAFNRKLDRKPVPRVALRIDYGAEHADTIEQRFAELANEDVSEHTPGTPPADGHSTS